ncbi:DUF4144 family protein [Oceanisphaera avium]|uniref:DUF4144 family protein n=1 Tax=Oceanisphaera avium TaxID=1903694 RepID=UPI0012F873D2|nr:DUF4144 family protein [Oceanisphaera avium]
MTFEPQWPVLLSDSQGGDFSLINNLLELEEHTLWLGCRLIDSLGRVSILSQTNATPLYWHLADELISVSVLNNELKAFAATLGLCCTSKLVIRSVSDAQHLVLWLEQQ